ncbi:MAG: molybdenum cofactor guanylyltransferase [Candidatus Infernicultor aquiphilus]|uniref:Probable molybdenum cofactor guanylyltransferase n=2 Tax=Candidatus Infernicultor aquiphilus TaxID=1805029 RepID=A0A2M7KB30_9BACT|nr:MAG: molybdenum cofactor guanylyltransferase [Candidatus Atribacteria bacterium CG_4_8_14_3_um_filter_34_18]PIY31276.1 MAG: molybdenum cofactor guanylyltransferase [Candidatus Atribacteria bacterium CG_4_10_14_3_um_filter_34_13]PJB57471.1 MAG: molybdenum cofactor guanylyltransferase [Candidatus Atribacteria bacterium CG_4_9_14_3_um_filter_33_16]
MILYKVMKIKDKRYFSLTAIILAGGESSRVGLNKSKDQMKLAGRLLIDWVISTLTSLDNLTKEDIIIVGSKEKYSNFKRVFKDIFPQKGPLGGIFSGLKASTSQYNLLVGCDMPFIEVKLLQYMIENINTYDMVIPCHGKGLIEPLCAIYSKSCLEVIERNIKAGVLSVREIFPHLKVKFIKEEEIKRFDAGLYSFFNINFKGDFTKAEELIKMRRIK